MAEHETEEEELLARKVAEFPKFVSERLPVLHEFAEDLELPDPVMILNDPSAYLGGIEDFMRNQVVEEDDWFWILARTAYFIGEVLVQRLGGCWLVNEDPGSRTFARYVVGEFSQISNHRAVVDPFEVAIEYLHTPPPRELRGLVDDTIEDLKSA